MMFLVELIFGGGVYTVYATDTANNTFLIYRSGHWAWVGLDKCRPYYAGALAAKETKDGHDSCN